MTEGMPIWRLIGRGSAHRIHRLRRRPYVARILKYNGTSWVAIGTGNAGGVAYYTSMDFDASNSPYVAYQHYSEGQKANAMRFNGSNW